MFTTLYGEYDNSLVANNFGFLRLPLDFTPAEHDADWVITGIPFDNATSGRAGARFGAEAIRRASVNLAWEEQRFPWNFRLGSKLKITDCGDLVYPFGNNAEFCRRLEEHASRLLTAGKKMLSFGGDHFVTLPLLRAHYKKFGPLALLHFDAHTDTYENKAAVYDHGTMFYVAPKEGLIKPQNSLQIGIRTGYDPGLGFTVLAAPEANELTAAAVVAEIKRLTAGLPIYLTFDIDCLDPAFAPGTGTPVIGGLTTDKVLKIIRALAAAALNIVGMDIVEVAPAYDHGGITALAAATIALELLYLQAAGV